MSTIRTMIRSAQVEMRAGDLSPREAVVLLAKLTSILGNTMDEVRAAECEYNDILLTCYRTEEKANRAKLIAESSPQYQRLRTAQDYKSLTLELMRALKAILRNQTEEMQLAR